MEQQRQVIVAMENALFAQRSTTSASEEAKLARIPQVIGFILFNNLLLFTNFIIIYRWERRSFNYNKRINFLERQLPMNSF